MTIIAIVTWRAFTILVMFKLDSAPRPVACVEAMLLSDRIPTYDGESSRGSKLITYVKRRSSPAKRDPTM